LPIIFNLRYSCKKRKCDAYRLRLTTLIAIPFCIGMSSRPDEDNRTTSLQVGKT